MHKLQFGRHCHGGGATQVYDAMTALGAKPAGLFAQSSMRIEKKYLAYGHELDTDMSPLSAGLGFAVNWNKDFIGRAALELHYKDALDARIRRDGKLEVSWDATVGEGAKSRAWITCSAPDGSDHHGLASSVSERRCVNDMSPLVGGKAVIKVMISDGFSCASGTSRKVNIPGQHSWCSNQASGIRSSPNLSATRLNRVIEQW